MFDLKGGRVLTLSSERLVKRALRKEIRDNSFHHDADLVDRVYGYIREY
jgi:hypothetical protein